MKDLKNLKVTELTKEQEAGLSKVEMSKIVGGIKEIMSKCSGGSGSISCSCTAVPVHGSGSSN